MTPQSHPRYMAMQQGWFRQTLRATTILVAVWFVVSSVVILALRWIDPPVTALMLQQSKTVHQRRHEWVDWGMISESAKLAVIAAEDQRFADHAGIDLVALRTALEERNGGGRLRGASTITQQLAKNLFLWPARSMLRKGFEAYFSLLLDALLPKQRILEIYLNVVEFGPGTYGVQAAGRAYFATDSNGLTDYEAALLAAVLPNPNRLRADAPSQYVRERARWIVEQMRRLRTEGALSRL